MKKFISIIVSFMFLLVVLGPQSVSAHELTDEYFHNGKIVSVNEVPVTADMLQKAKIKGSAPNTTNLITSSVTCKHSYSSWRKISFHYEEPEDYGDCFIKNEYQTRYCTKCGVSFGREVKIQLYHAGKYEYNKGTKCKLCGKYFGIA